MPEGAAMIPAEQDNEFGIETLDLFGRRDQRRAELPPKPLLAVPFLARAVACAHDQSTRHDSIPSISDANVR